MIFQKYYQYCIKHIHASSLLQEYYFKKLYKIGVEYSQHAKVWLKEITSKVSISQVRQGVVSDPILLYVLFIY